MGFGASLVALELDQMRAFQRVEVDGGGSDAAGKQLEMVGCCRWCDCVASVDAAARDDAPVERLCCCRCYAAAVLVHAWRAQPEWLISAMLHMPSLPGAAALTCSLCYCSTHVAAADLHRLPTYPHRA